MAGQKHLHELLKEDQEPFHLKNYIADKCYLLKRSNPPKTTALQVKKRKPIVETSSTVAKRSLCKQACFFAFHDSPDVTKSPLPDFLSPAKSPCRTRNGTVFLHIPARTAAVLLEAAMRIQKQQSSSHPKSKAQIKNVGFGIFSSILKKLKDRNRNKKCEIQDRQTNNSPRRAEVRMEEKMGARSPHEVGFSCSCNNSRHSSAGWSESNEERSLDMETSTSSSRSEDSEELDYVAREPQSDPFTPFEKRFCSSPVSPFRFSLQRSPSSGRRTPIFSSPAASPSRRKREDEENYGATGLEKIPVEEEDEKDQCSPVSVLDPPFDNEEEGHDSGDEEDYDVECSFAIVQRAKEQLLYKLRRFEKLAELDPVELEKRMMEQLDDEDVEEDEHQDDEEQSEDNEFFLTYKTCSLDSFVNEVLSKSDLLSRTKVPADMKRLVSDLISEENSETIGLDSREIVLGRVCRKLDSWKEVESNTIDMMVELDFRREFDQWKRFEEQKEETAVEIELAIFGLLVEELTAELK